MGVVSEDKLLELLELAMSSNATETVRRSREVMDSGVDPLVLISQLVTLIVDIIAGTHLSVDAKHNDSFFGGRTRKSICVNSCLLLKWNSLQLCMLLSFYFHPVNRWASVVPKELANS